MKSLLYKKLKQHRERLINSQASKVLPDNRKIGVAGLNLDYSRHLLDELAWQDLLLLAKEKQLSKAIRDLFSGELVNNTEQRAASHTLLRASGDQVSNNSNMLDILDLRKKMASYSEQLLTGIIRGSTNKKITDVVNIGIGGSALGPKFACLALQEYKSSQIDMHFVANIDPEEIYSLLKKLNPETTLFIICSKSFKTQETLENARVAKSWLIDNLGYSAKINKHLVAVTANTEEALVFGLSVDSVFPMWEWVGGRYSICSAVGLSLSIAIGFANFNKLLDGARAMDEHFHTMELAQNMPVILGLLSIWYVNICGANSQAILPYSSRLELLPAYLQQLLMESNGKSVNKSGEEVSYATCPIIWGGAGTNSQHSFFQLLHQGTHIVPCDFILPMTNSKYPEQHQLLVANCLAQMQALMHGRELNFGDDKQKFIEKHKYCIGSRPSNLIYFKEISPQILGSLISLYEHKTYVESVIWDINPFDQFGVELGKILAKDMLEALCGESSELLPKIKIDSVSQQIIEEIKKAHKNKVVV